MKIRHPLPRPLRVMATYCPVTEQDDLSPLTRDQLKALLHWPNASPDVTREMMLVAIQNRLRLGRLSAADLERVA